jgi:predicted methyltransferase
MSRPASLASLIDWSHRLLAEILQPGDLAVDLTAGNGSDTLFLAEQVGRSGLVLAFDIQRQALAKTAVFLEAAGIKPVLHQGRRAPKTRSGVVLVPAGHEAVADYLPAAPKAFIANLGYLPGGDKSIITRPNTTLKAINAALAGLAPHGRLAVVVYVGHPGGRDEGEQLELMLQELSPAGWEVTRIQALNRQLAPYLLVVEKQ